MAADRLSSARALPDSPVAQTLGHWLKVGVCRSRRQVLVVGTLLLDVRVDMCVLLLS
jgi:hypothetical protein